MVIRNRKIFLKADIGQRVTFIVCISIMFFLQHIRHPVSKGIGATLTMVQKSSVKVELEPEEFVPPTTPKKEHRELPNGETHTRE